MVRTPCACAFSLAFRLLSCFGSEMLAYRACGLFSVYASNITQRKPPATRILYSKRFWRTPRLEVAIEGGELPGENCLPVSGFNRHSIGPLKGLRDHNFPCAVRTALEACD